MNESKFNVGDTVTIIDVDRQGEVVSVSDDGSTYEVKSTNADGAEQLLTCKADNLEAADEETEEDEEAPEGTEAEDKE